MAFPTLPAKPAALSLTAYDNVCRSRWTPIDRKRVYLVAIAACGNDTAKAKAEHDLQRKGELRRGSRPSRLLPDEGLGVLMSESQFARKTADKFGMTATKFKKQLDAWLRYHAKRLRGEEPTESERKKADGFLRATIPARQDGEIWLFRHPDRKVDAFEGLLDKWLGHRLGLDIVPGEVRLTFGFRAAHVQNCTQPRFLDATWGYLPLWDWRGKTRPLPGAPTGLNGLEEVVADPPELRHLNRAVERVPSAIP